MDEHRVRTTAIVLAILGGAIVLALVLTGALRGPRGSSATATSLPDGAPTTVLGAPVLSVSAAVAIQAQDDSNEIAVGGWFQQSYELPCPAPLEPVVPLLNGNCTIGMTWLMENPEVLIHSTNNAGGGSNDGHAPRSPAVNPVFDGPSIDWANPLPQNGDSRPTPVVFIGHFDDARAVGCQPADRQLCRDRFVVTTVAWANGQTLK